MRRVVHRAAEPLDLSIEVAVFHIPAQYLCVFAYVFADGQVVLLRVGGVIIFMFGMDVDGSAGKQMVVYATTQLWR